MQHAGQDIPALVLDAEEVRPLDIPEFFDIMVTLASFYDFSACKRTKSSKPVLSLIDEEVPAKRETIIRNLETKMDRMKMTEE